MNRQFTYGLNRLYDNSTQIGQLLQDNAYKNDNVGNIISIDDNGLNARNQNFEYDNINRLICSKGGGWIAKVRVLAMRLTAHIPLLDVY